MGGEDTPRVIGYPMSKKEKLIEIIRRASQVFFKMTPNFFRTIVCANMILATTEETKNLIPKKYHSKVKIFQSIGLPEDIFTLAPAEKPCRTPQFLVAGRMMYWKGFELAIRALVRA